MPHELPKAYEPGAIETRWAEYWIKEKLFSVQTPPAGSPSEKTTRPVFTLLLPPPNVTGRLHMGHMLNQTQMDIIVRWHRMRGFITLWLPGTDHAGIATQMMVERQLANEGKKRRDLGREKFIERVWEWKKLYGGAILDQMKRLGASVDWDREYFTMDENLSRAVREVFVRLYEEGLIYRGKYIVNWCPRCETAISDLEVKHEDVAGKLWEIRYPVVGSGRVHHGGDDASGDDAGRYRDRGECEGRALHASARQESSAAADESRDSDHHRRTGAAGVWHRRGEGDAGARSQRFSGRAAPQSAADRRDGRARAHERERRRVCGSRSLRSAQARAGRFAGAGISGRRKRSHALARQMRSLRDGGRAAASEQWFIKIKPLADRAIEAVESGEITIVPDNYRQIYLNWMNNIHDWCISRQLWWGHRIPAWTCGDCKRNDCRARDSGEVYEVRRRASWSRYPTCSTPGSRPDCCRLRLWAGRRRRAIWKCSIPTTLLITGFDILFFWVARMIMFGCHFMQGHQQDPAIKTASGWGDKKDDSVPFRHVYIHALVRDADRQKMSKTKGNVIDPLEIIERFGTDATRFTLAAMAAPGTDIAFNESRTDGYRAFANKIWNAARFMFMNVDRVEPGWACATLARRAAASRRPHFRAATLEDRWILSRFNRVAADVNDALETYRFHEAANRIYDFFWGEFCDWYLELIKPRLNFEEGADKSAAQAACANLVNLFEASLRLLHPVMPFITEEIWQAMYDGKPPLKSIALAAYPQADEKQIRSRRRDRDGDPAGSDRQRAQSAGGVEG